MSFYILVRKEEKISIFISFSNEFVEPYFQENLCRAHAFEPTIERTNWIAVQSQTLELENEAKSMKIKTMLDRSLGFDHIKIGMVKRLRFITCGHFFTWRREAIVAGCCGLQTEEKRTD